MGEREGLVAVETIGTSDLFAISMTKSAWVDVCGPNIACTWTFFKRSIAAQKFDKALDCHNPISLHSQVLTNVVQEIPLNRSKIITFSDLKDFWKKLLSVSFTTNNRSRIMIFPYLLFVFIL